MENKSPYRKVAGEKTITSHQEAIAYRKRRQAHWDSIARMADKGPSWGACYHSRLIEIYRFLIPEGRRVLEIGCGEGDLLAALRPATGVGIDFSNEKLKRGRARHTGISFVQCDAEELCVRGTFDFIVLSDVVNDLWDVQKALEQVLPLCDRRTRVILNTYSRLWELPLALAKRLGLATVLLPQNWLTAEDMANLLNLADFEVIRRWTEILWPFDTPFVQAFFNRVLVKLWPFHAFALTHFLVSRPNPKAVEIEKKPRVSIIVPARNESGNIHSILFRTPHMGVGTELVFVEGHSDDNTYGKIAEAMANHPECACKLIQQVGIGKGDAVQRGIQEADGEMLMILDADLTVSPETLPRFYEALISGKCDVANGVRLVYPMEERAMRFANLVANRFFSLAFSWLLGQPVKDTLCGTKVFWRDDYEWIAALHKDFAGRDPFGDFYLLFGAARLNLKIMDIPVRYAERTYGKTNIRRWRHGLLLLKMAFIALKEMKFV